MSLTARQLIFSSWSVTARISTASSQRSATFSGEWKWLTRSIARLRKMRSRRFRFASRAPRSRPARNREMTSLKLIQVAVLAAILCSVTACSDVLLSQPNVDLKAETPEGTTALMLAVWRERAETVRKLLQRGADANHQDKEGDASVHGAAWFGNTPILGLLLDAGANPNVKNKLGGTPLMWAASYGEDAAVRMLLERGADPRIKDVDGVTAAGWAAKNGRGNLEMILRQAEKGK